MRLINPAEILFDKKTSNQAIEQANEQTSVTNNQIFSNLLYIIAIAKQASTTHTTTTITLTLTISTTTTATTTTTIKTTDDDDDDDYMYYGPITRMETLVLVLLLMRMLVLVRVIPTVATEPNTSRIQRATFLHPQTTSQETNNINKKKTSTFLIVISCGFLSPMCHLVFVFVYCLA